MQEIQAEVTQSLTLKVDLVSIIVFWQEEDCYSTTEILKSLSQSMVVEKCFRKLMLRPNPQVIDDPFTDLDESDEVGEDRDSTVKTLS